MDKEAMDKETELFFTCSDCLYTFSSNIMPNCCPDCGKPKVRAATQSEIDGLDRYDYYYTSLDKAIRIARPPRELTSVLMSNQQEGGSHLACKIQPISVYFFR